MDYSTLVSKVLSIDVLDKEIKEMADGKCLNLVAEDWNERLENNVTFQNYNSHSKELWMPAASKKHYEFQNSTCPNFQVVIVAECKFYTPWPKEKEDKKYQSQESLKPTLIILNSEPLVKIARAMTSDLGPNIQLSCDSKFKFTPCGVLTCSDCAYNANDCRQKGYYLSDLTLACIQDIKVYDGLEVENRFQCQLMEEFPQTFFAALRLKISSRYNVKDSNDQKSFRISGKVLKLLGFAEKKLTVAKKVKINMASLRPIENKVLNDVEAQELEDDIPDSLRPHVIIEDKSLQSTRKRKLEAEENEDYEVETYFME